MAKDDKDTKEDARKPARAKGGAQRRFRVKNRFMDVNGKTHPEGEEIATTDQMTEEQIADLEANANAGNIEEVSEEGEDTAAAS